MSNTDKEPDEKNGNQSGVWVWIIVGGALLLFFAIGQFVGSLFGV